MIGRCPGHRPQRAGSAAVIAATLLAVTACGASPTSPNQAPGATGTAVPTPSATVVSAAASATPAASEAPAQAPQATKIQVPEGTGLDYQSAQDLWRAAGLLVAPAKDVTGANRIPVIDANWIVVSQDPKAGAQVAVGSLITATVKKDSDG